MFFQVGNPYLLRFALAVLHVASEQVRCTGIGREEKVPVIEVAELDIGPKQLVHAGGQRRGFHPRRGGERERRNENGRHVRQQKQAEHPTPPGSERLCGITGKRTHGNGIP